MLVLKLSQCKGTRGSVAVSGVLSQQRTSWPSASTVETAGISVEQTGIA
ncbi:hypothetical protein AHiyo8_pI68680 (plasmid) [Arthrobacter sp. Hiyo8]|nr:hypothetical protein AHiyo8_pI68680 [Arthrobacter sp. Hiyo8]